MRSASPGLWLLAVLVVAIVAAWVARQSAAPLDAEPTPIEVDRQRLVRQSETGLVTLDGAPFTGLALDRYDDGSLAEREAYVDGRKDGRTERWLPDGTLSYRADYRAGRRHGTAVTWWADGTPRSASRYVGGVAHGVQRQWYRSGARFKELTLVEGREVGRQRAWRENGVLYSNYEARDGRIYGLKRATLCFTLDDESITQRSRQP